MILLIFPLFLCFTQYCKTESPPMVLPRLPMKIAVLDIMPFVHVKKESNGSEEFQGFIPDLFEQLFSSPHDRAFIVPEFYLVPDGKFGEKLQNGTFDKGTWNGMIGEVVSKKAFMAAGPLTINAGRLDAVKFSFPFMPVNIVPIMKKPTKQGTKMPFRDIKEMTEAAGRGKLTYGVQKGGSTESMMKNSKYSLYKGMYDQMVHTEEQGGQSFATSYKEAIERVSNGSGYVFLGEDSTLSYMAGLKPCDLLLWGRETLNTAFYGLAFNKDVQDDVLDSINHKIIELQQSGAMKLLKEKWWQMKSECGYKRPKLCICSDPDDDDHGVRRKNSTKNSEESGESGETVVHTL